MGKNKAKQVGGWGWAVATGDLVRRLRQKGGRSDRVAALNRLHAFRARINGVRSRYSMQMQRGGGRQRGGNNQILSALAPHIRAASLAAGGVGMWYGMKKLRNALKQKGGRHSDWYWSAIDKL